MKVHNIIGIMVPLSSSWFTAELFTFLYGKVMNSLEIYGISFPIGIFFIYITSIFTTGILGISKLNSIITIFIFLILAFYFRLKNSNIHVRRLKIPISALIFLFINLCFFSYLTYKSYFYQKGKVILSGENDLQLEFSLIESFLKGSNNHFGFSGIRCPLFPSEKIVSETPPALFEAYLIAGGLSRRYAIIGTTIGLFFSAILLQFSFTYRLFSSFYSASLSVPLLFLISGFGFKRFLSTGHSYPLSDFVFVQDPNTIVQWGNPLLHCYLTSRANLMALCISIFALITKESHLNFINLLLLIATSIVRKQSGIVLGFMILFYVSSSFDLNNLNLKKIFKQFNHIPNLNLISFVSSLIGYIIILLINRKDIHITSPLFLVDQPDGTIFPALQFPISIFGFAFIILPISCFFSNHRLQFILTITCFYTFNFISLQPILRYNFFSILSSIVPLLSALVCGSSIYFAMRLPSPELSGILLVVFSIFTAFSCSSTLAGIWHRRNQYLRIFGVEEKEVAQWIIHNTSIDAVFASPQISSWNPSIFLAGRNILTTGFQTMPFFSFNFSQPYQTLWQWTFQNKDDSQWLIHPSYLIHELNTNWIDEINLKILRRQLNVVYKNSKYRILEWNS